MTLNEENEEKLVQSDTVKDDARICLEQGKTGMAAAIAKTNANGFDFCWEEKTSLIESVLRFGYGNFEKIYAVACDLNRNNKSMFEVKAFCRRYAQIVCARNEGLCPLLEKTLRETQGDEEDERAMDGEEEDLNEVFADRRFYVYCKERSSREDALRLEMLLCGWEKVCEIGGIEGASMELEIPDVSMNGTNNARVAAPAKWWNEAHDRALICGTFKWGYGKFSEIRDDEELAFAWDFKGKVCAPLMQEAPSSTNSVVAVEGGEKDAMTMNVSQEENQWVHGKHLAFRLRRLFAALGNRPLNAFTVKQTTKQTTTKQTTTTTTTTTTLSKKKEKQAKEPKEGKPKQEKKQKEPALGRRAGGDNESKVERAEQVVEVLQRDENNAFKMPAGPFSGVTIECLGKVLHSTEDANKAWVSTNYILPVGYRSTKQFSKLDARDLEEKCTWTQEIKRNKTDGTPLFSLTSEDGSIVIEKKSATACWADVLSRAKTIRESAGEQAKKTAISGPEFFGYSAITVRLMIESLPDAEKCAKYINLKKTVGETTLAAKPPISSTKATPLKTLSPSINNAHSRDENLKSSAKKRPSPSNEIIVDAAATEITPTKKAKSTPTPTPQKISSVSQKIFSAAKNIFFSPKKLPTTTQER